MGAAKNAGFDANAQQHFFQNSSFFTGNETDTGRQQQ